MPFLEVVIYFFQSIAGMLTLGYRRPVLGSVILAILLGLGFGFYRSYTNDPEASMPIGGLIVVYGLIGIYALATLRGLVKRWRLGPPVEEKS